MVSTNLKNELINDEQLDEVSGGSLIETFSLCALIADKGGAGTSAIKSAMDSFSGGVLSMALYLKPLLEAYLESKGYEVELNTFASNKYSLNGKSISHQEMKDRFTETQYNPMPPIPSPKPIMPLYF